MSATNYGFAVPLDVQFLRGNRLFGEPGSHGEAFVPPWPSLAAGALRSHRLAEDGVDFQSFALGDVNHPCLGTPSDPGPMRLVHFGLARRTPGGAVEALYPAPADLIVSTAADGSPQPALLRPRALPPGLACSAITPLLPALQAGKRAKAQGGWWLTAAGWKRYLAGSLPDATQLVPQVDLWQTDHRVGVGLDLQTRRASDGKLFSMQAVAFHTSQTGSADIGFLLGIQGAPMPRDALLRWGGDGRAVRLAAVSSPDGGGEADLEAICRNRRCRLVLTSPGLFQQGWLPNGFRSQGEAVLFSLHGTAGRLVAAALSRAEVVSGWDLARRRPKTALRAAPAGSVYWVEELEATPASLRKLADEGLWSEQCEDAPRRAEGFNRITIAI